MNESFLIPLCGKPQINSSIMFRGTPWLGSQLIYSSKHVNHKINGIAKTILTVPLMLRLLWRALIVKLRPLLRISK